jgi:DNA repair protein RadC
MTVSLARSAVYVGNVNTSVIRVGELFGEAVRLNCAAMIVAHNHPSGDPTPSPDDVRVTEQIVQAGRLLDIEVLDHLIVGRQRNVSLKERGLGFGAASQRGREPEAILRTPIARHL